MCGGIVVRREHRYGSLGCAKVGELLDCHFLASGEGSEDVGGGGGGWTWWTNAHPSTV